MSEQLYTCPVCQRKNYTLRGLKAHRCQAKRRRRLTPTGPLEHPPLTDAEIALAIERAKRY